MREVEVEAGATVTVDDYEPRSIIEEGTADVLADGDKRARPWPWRHLRRD